MLGGPFRRSSRQRCPLMLAAASLAGLRRMCGVHGALRARYCLPDCYRSRCDEPRPAHPGPQTQQAHTAGPPTRLPRPTQAPSRQRSPTREPQHRPSRPSCIPPRKPAPAHRCVLCQLKALRGRPQAGAVGEQIGEVVRGPARGPSRCSHQPAGISLDAAAAWRPAQRRSGQPVAPRGRQPLANPPSGLTGPGGADAEADGELVLPLRAPQGSRYGASTAALARVLGLPSTPTWSPCRARYAGSSSCS
jgi:hypothetical protein